MYSGETVTSVTDETLLWTTADQEAYSRLSGTLGQLIQSEVDTGQIYGPQQYQETRTQYPTPERPSVGRHRRLDEDPYNDYQAPPWETGAQPTSTDPYLDSARQPRGYPRTYQRADRPAPTTEAYWRPTSDRYHATDRPRPRAPRPEDDLQPLHLDLEDQPEDHRRRQPKIRPGASPSHREEERRPTNSGPGREFKPSRKTWEGSEIKRHRRQSRVSRVAGRLAIVASFGTGLFCLIEGVTNHLAS